jgi:hypothetical protein
MNTNPAPTPGYAIKPNVRYRIIDDEAIIVNQKSAMLYLCNELGSFVLDKIRDGLPKDEIINAICSEYEVDNQAAEQDLLEFIESLIKVDAIEVIDDT